MKLFVWDFHGVLEKDNEHAVVEVTNQVLEEFGYKPSLTLKVAKELYGLKWGIYFKQLAPEADEETVLKMVDRGVEISNTTDVIFRHIKPMDNCHEVLEKIRKAGHENMIISNTQPEALDRYLNAVKIMPFITHKIGADSHRKDPHTRNSKIKLLKEFLNSKNYDKVIVIGDRDTDMELGEAVGAINYYFINEFNKRLERYSCISDLKEVLKEV
jgi:phosphoglycolate phosphatase-like HAD superfamily hydrolase